MKTICGTLAIGLFLGFSLSADAAGNETSQPVNFYLFSNQEKMITDGLLKWTPEEFRNHPDLGKLPAGSPCRDCYEDVSKRQADARYYITKGSNGSHFFKQQSVGAINYKDDNGQWREINPSLQLPVVPGEFHASRQPNPVVIDMNGKFSSIESNGYKIEFNRVLELFHLDNHRNLTSLGTPDWSDYTAGDEGVKIHNFYPGIDLEFIVYEGKLKTNIVLNSKLNYADGWLVMKQQFNLPAGLKMDGSVAMLDNRGKLKGEVPIVNESGLPIFTIHESVIYDNNQSSQSRMIASSDFNKMNQFFVYVPCNWLASPSLVYPVTIDPLVTAIQSMPQVNIVGSSYSSACYAGGCVYNMPSISVPTACTVTNVTTTFSYSASNLCSMKDGGIIVHYGACRAPSTMAFLNPSDVAGNASISASLMPYIETCIPAPQCASYNMDFSMDFYRCQDNVAGCNSNCISANSAWVVTVEGHTMEIESITPDHFVCTGGSTSLSATANYGVGPYTYSWTPGGGAGQTIIVAPAGTQVYTCSVTNACGMTTDQTTTATVTASAPPTVTITPSGTVCASTNITFTATANNGGSAPIYEWYIGTFLQQIGPSNSFTTTVFYPDSVSVQMTSNSPCASTPNASAGLRIAPTPSSSITITSNPPLGPYCVGQIVTLTATPTNGGPSPLFGWSTGLAQSGIFIWTTSNTFSYIVQPGIKTFRSWLVSSLPCVTNDTVSSGTKGITGTLTTQPNIAITQTPGVSCFGSPITFNTSSNGGGSLPVYEWFVNGVSVLNSNSSYTTSTLANGDVVSVVLTSNVSCPTTPTDTDSMTVTIVPSVVPAVSIAQVPGNPLCPQECVVFSAMHTSGGITPSFQWKLNAVNVGSNSSIFSSCSLIDGDIVSVRMTSNASCAMPLNVSYFSTISVVFIDTTAVLSGITLTSNEQGGTYQWLRCDSGFAAISGATGQSYTAIANGSYAVFITKSGCSDTSVCYPILNVGIDPVSGPEHLHVYPNPTRESVTLRSDAFPDGNYEIKFFDVLRKELHSQSLVVKQHQLDALFSLKDAAPGFYFLRISSESYQRIIKIIRQ